MQRNCQNQDHKKEAYRVTETNRKLFPTDLSAKLELTERAFKFILVTA